MKKDGTPDKPAEANLNRRDLFKAAGALLAVGGLAACEPQEQVTSASSADLTLSRVPFEEQYAPVPYPPAQVPTPVLNFFTPHEAATVEDFTARLLPGTPDDPGAREAGVVYYIDGLLAQGGIVEATYLEPPYAQPYEGAIPAPMAGVIWVPASQIERYGYQSRLKPPEVYRVGLSWLDMYSGQRFQQDFASLSQAQQDQIITLMAEGDAGDIDRNLSAQGFFHTLRRHTMEGMFADPVYGGNRNLVGWRLIRYPGAQRAYTPDDMLQEGLALRIQPQSMADLPHFHPGQNANVHVILPVRGSEDRDNPPPSALPHVHR